jgi:hypothetical protein
VAATAGTQNDGQRPSTYASRRAFDRRTAVLIPYAHSPQHSATPTIHRAVTTVATSPPRLAGATHARRRVEQAHEPYDPGQTGLLDLGWLRGRGIPHHRLLSAAAVIAWQASVALDGARRDRSRGRSQRARS